MGNAAYPPLTRDKDNYYAPSFQHRLKEDYGKQHNNGALQNWDIPGSTINHQRWSRERKDYNTLDYSDVTYGNKEGGMGDGNVAHLNKRNNKGKSTLPMGRGLQPSDLKPEQLMPVNVWAKVAHAPPE